MCNWEQNKDGFWETDCGEIFVINDGTPYDNKMIFCCYCGGVLLEKRYIEKEESWQEF